MTPKTAPLPEPTEPQTLAVSDARSLRLGGYPPVLVERIIVTAEALDAARSALARAEEKLAQYESYGITVASALKDREQREAAERELRSVDSALARRPALADAPDRATAIERACRRAGQADLALSNTGLTDAIARAETAERERDEARAEFHREHGVAASLTARLDAAEKALAEARGENSKALLAVDEMMEKLDAATTEAAVLRADVAAYRDLLESAKVVLLEVQQQETADVHDLISAIDDNLTARAALSPEPTND